MELIRNYRGVYKIYKREFEIIEEVFGIYKSIFEIIKEVYRIYKREF